MPAEGAIQSPAVAQVSEHLNAVLAAAEKEIHDAAAKKALQDSVKAVLRRLDDDRQTIDRYAELGDPVRAVRGTFAPSVTSRTVARLVEHGWVEALLIGRKSHYRYLIGERLYPETGGNVAARKGSR